MDSIYNFQYIGMQFHAACWSILETLDSELDLRVFFKFCRSFPQKDSAVLWDSVSRGMLPLDQPWRRLTLRSVGHFGSPEQEAAFLNIIDPDMPYTRLNPYTIPEIDEWLQNTPPFNDGFGLSQEFGASIADIFMQLPTELLDFILCELPSSAIASLRSASKTFANLTLSRSFWKSRFQPGQEFEHVFETRRLNMQSSINWKGLYSHIKTSTPEALTRRRLIWSSAKPILAAMKPYATAECQGISEDERSSSKVPFRFVNGDMDPDMVRGGSARCKALYIRTVSLPRFLSHVDVSCIQYRNSQFIAGLEFIAPDGTSTSLGYILPQRFRKRIYDCPGRRGGRLYGFDLAVGTQGIQGISICEGACDQVQPWRRWAGDTVGLPMTRFHGSNGPIRTLRATFDVGLPLRRFRRDLTATIGLQGDRVWTSENDTQILRKCSKHLLLATFLTSFT